MTRQLALRPIILIFMFVAFTPSSQANIVSNGGFELPVLTVPNVQHASGSGGLTGWAIAGTSGIDHVVGTLWQPAEGNQSISLNWLSPSTISQTLSTVATQNYSLTFSLAAELPQLNATIRTVDVFWGATLVDSLSIDPAGNTDANMGWQTFSYNVSGTGSDILSFESTIAGAFGAAIDNVSVTAVPVPAAVWLFTSGLFVLAGGRLRSRQRTHS